MKEVYQAVCNGTQGLPNIARVLLQHIGNTRVVLLEGGMGAGKTTLVKQLCDTLQVTDNVTSPTFTIVNEYATKSGEPVFHFDLYRLEKESEALDFGMEDYLCSGHYCFIEWPEKAPNLLSEDTVKIKIDVHNQERTFKLLV
ncbi:MAG: tRNA (adenosine(37)-N6)-threonylcarbamoyltransferase complex ATPase subunit type 1 TsaE [Bacteroidota bacterium]